jgi:hypothetical protein
MRRFSPQLSDFNQNRNLHTKCSKLTWYLSLSTYGCRVVAEGRMGWQGAEGAGGGGHTHTHTHTHFIANKINF